MTTTQLNLLVYLFFVQHQGKRLCDVISTSSIRATIDKISYNDKRAQIIGSVKDSFVVLHLLYYNGLEDSYQTPNDYYSSSISINLLDYISFEDSI